MIRDKQTLEQEGREIVSETVWPHDITVSELLGELDRLAKLGYGDAVLIGKNQIRVEASQDNSATVYLTQATIYYWSPPIAVDNPAVDHTAREQVTDWQTVRTETGRFYVQPDLDRDKSREAFDREAYVWLWIFVVVVLAVAAAVLINRGTA